MAAAAFAGLLSGFEYQKRREDAVAQADDGIADLALFVETRDLEVEFAQDPHGPVQASLASDQADIIPHRVLDRQPILSDEDGVRRFMFVAPIRHFGKVEIVASRDAFGGMLPGPRSPNQAFEQGSAGQAVGAVQSGAGDLARRQPRGCRQQVVLGFRLRAIDDSALRPISIAFLRFFGARQQNDLAAPFGGVPGGRQASQAEDIGLSGVLHHAGSISKLKSTAGAEWVSAPTEIQSTPVSANCLMSASVIPPEASMRIFFVRSRAGSRARACACSR